MSELLDLHSSHLVDALNAAMGGCPRAAMRSLQDAEIVAAELAIEVDRASENG